MSSSSSGSTLLPAGWINQTVDGQQYDVLLPANYNPSTKYPTILYLHQLDAGNDPTSLVNEVNGWFNTSDFRGNYPAIIVMPILDQTSDPSGNTNNWGGVSGDKPGTQFAIDALKAVQSQYSTDSSRTYVTGPSMGGQGTDQMMQDYGPNSATPIFAAGYSMAGMMANETSQQFYAAIGNAPMEAVHGTADTTNPPGFDQGLAAIDPDFQLTQVQGAGHDVWDPQPNAGIAGYSNDAAWTWLFQQQLGGASNNSGSGSSGSGSVSGSTAGTRDPSQIPFASNSVFNLPFGTGAQWTPNSQLESAGLVINTANVTGYTQDIYTGTASDPVITVTNQAGAGGTPGVFQVHIPAGAVPASGNDRTFSVDDQVTHTWYSFGQWTWTGPNSATVQQGSGEPDYDSGISVDNSNWDEGVGTLRESDLQAGAISHMLRIEIPSDMALSYSQTSTNVLAPNAWPQTAEDGYANNGQGGAPYTGTIPYGATIGIPDNVAEPADIKANAGANMFWQEMQTHGAMVRDTTDTSNEGKITFQADQNVNGNDPLILGMEQYGAEILSYAQILANQGPNSVNGGGTPIVPLDPNPNDLPGGSGGGGTTGGGGSGSTPSPSGTIITPGVGVITDAAGNIYNILPDGATYENQQPMAEGGNTAKMEYYNGQIYGQDATSQTWYTWNQTSWTAASAPSTGSGGGSTGGGGTTTPPPSGTIITPGSGTLSDSSGNTYTLSSQDVAMENGSAIPGGWGTGEMEYYNGQIYGQDATSQTWYTWNQTSWTAASAPSTGSGGGSTGGGGTTTPPSGGTIITPGSGTFTDSSGNTYTLSSQDVAMENGNAIPGGWGTGEMEYYNGQIYGQAAASQTWYTWNQTSWTAAAAPAGPGPTNVVAAMAAGPTPVTLAANQPTYVDSTGNVAISATAGDHMVFLNGSGDSADLTGGNESLTTTSNNSIVTGSGNDSVVASGTGNSVSLGTGDNTFTDNGSNNDLILVSGGVTAAKGQFATNGDTFDMRQVMAATDWNDQTSTLNSYLSLTQAGGFTSVSVSNTSGGTATQVALIQGSLTAAQFEARALFH